jgi:hypothetical protein
MLDSPTSPRLVNKVDTKEVQQQAPKDEISKRPLMRNVFKMRLVLLVCLDAQRGCEDELADCCAETGEESVERLLIESVSPLIFIATGS